MAERLILALYDANDAGSRGLLWKAVNGDNTLYLLGTIHMDRSNVYPCISRCGTPGRLPGGELRAGSQRPGGHGPAGPAPAYSDGTTLADHISRSCTHGCRRRR